MKAIVVAAYGGPDRLEIIEQAAPEPGEGQVSIDVAFAGVGFVDTLIRSGKFDFIKPPLTPGIEVSGHVRAAGPGVTGLAPGQAVAALLTDFTRAGLGGYAQVALAQAALTVPLPAGVDLAIAAATIVNGATAVMAMDGVGPSAAVAISGASGGLGRSLIAAARGAGANRIIAVSSKPSSAEELRSLGASETLSSEDLDGLGEELDFAFDTVGGEIRLALLRSLRPGGRLMLLGNASGSDPALSGDEIWLRNIAVAGLSTGGLSHLVPDRIAAAARQALEATRADLPAPTILGLDEAPEAHRRLEAGAGGKIVLDVRSIEGG